MRHVLSQVPELPSVLLHLGKPRDVVLKHSELFSNISFAQLLSYKALKAGCKSRALHPRSLMHFQKVFSLLCFAFHSPDDKKADVSKSKINHLSVLQASR